MPNKFNLTVYNIFKIIKYILSKKLFTVAEIVSFLESENIFVEQETVYKYIRTLNVMGFHFEKINSIEYRITKMPFCFTDENNKILINILNKLEQSTLSKKMELYKKIGSFLPENLQKDLLKKEDNISQLEKFLNDGLRLKLFFSINDKKETIFEMYNILKENASTFLQGYDVNRKEIAVYAVKDLSKMEQTPIRNKFFYDKREAVLKFSNKVSKSYILKEEDELIEKTDNSLLIKTVFYDKILFYKKILRYAQNCEIVSPASLREDFKTYLSELYQMYDCSMAK